MESKIKVNNTLVHDYFKHIYGSVNSVSIENKEYSIALDNLIADIDHVLEPPNLLSKAWTKKS